VCYVYKISEMEKRLLELLALAFQDELSENEREELDLLLREFPEYRDMAKKLQFSREHVDELELVGTIRVEEKWQELRKKNKRSRSRKMLFFSIASVAAMLLFAVGISFLLFPSSEMEVIPVARKQEPKKVTLEYADGKTLTLDVKSLIVEGKGRTTDSIITGELENMAAKEIRLNRLFVPKGCDFSLILTDVADELNVSVNTVRSHMYMAIATLKKSLK